MSGLAQRAAPLARTPGRTARFVSTVVLLVIACTVASALACLIGYALSGERRPIVLLSTDAADYARQSLFKDEAQMAAFTARLQALAAATRTSVAVTYIERPQQGETLADATERAVKGLETELAQRKDEYERSMLVIVLMGKPRIFGFVGNDQARTRLFLRNLSGDPALHSLNFKHIQVQHGRYLMQALDIAEAGLRPLHPLMQHHPAQGIVLTLLETVGSVPELPGEIVLAIVRWVRAPLVNLATEHGVPPLALLFGPLVLLSLAFNRIEKLARRRLKGALLKTGVWALCKGVPIPAAGIIAVVLYGSLENIASLSQMSGQPLLDLLQFARNLPTPAIPEWVSWLAIPAAGVVTLGVTLGIGLRMTGHDARLLITPGQWFAGLPLPLRLALQAVLLALVLLLPVPLMVALASMRGLMAVALLATLLMMWTDDIYDFWKALGAAPVPAAGAGRAFGSV